MLSANSKVKVPLISVIMPVYNCERYVAEAIDSILKQDFCDWELLICDDGSSDQSLLIAQHYAAKDSRITVTRNQCNIGKIKIVNDTFKLTKGEIITIHDADDYSHEYRFRIIFNEFNKDPNLHMVGSNAIVIDRNGVLLREDIRPETYEDILKTLPLKSAFCGATVFIRREVINKLGLYRDYFDGFSYEDYDLTYRIAEQFKSINVPKPLYYYRQVPGSYSKMISIKRAVSKDLVLWLAGMRKTRTLDFLDMQEIERVNLFVEDRIAPYRKDKSLIYREYAATFMYNKLHIQAIQASIQAIKAQPLKFVNYRTLFYCLRKTLLS